MEAEWTFRFFSEATPAMAAAVPALRSGGAADSVSRQQRDAVLRNLAAHTYTRVAKSDIHGVGVFAVRPIPAKTDPFDLCNHAMAPRRIVNISDQDMDRAGVAGAVRDMVRDFFGRNADGSYPVHLQGANALNVSFFMNHNADSPNMVLVSNHSDASDEFCKFVAARDIAIGEELTFAYPWTSRLDA